MRAPAGGLKHTLISGGVHAALAYCYDHQDVIRQDWVNADALIGRLREQYPSRRGERGGPVR